MADERTFTASELKRITGDVLNAATKRPVVITQHSKPRHVVLSYDDYVRMFKRKDPRRVYSIEETPDEVADILVSAIDDYLENPED